MGRLQHPKPPKRIGAPSTANIRDSAGDGSGPGEFDCRAKRGVGTAFGKSCDCLELFDSCGGLAFVMCLFVAGFVLLFGRRLVAQAIKIARRCAVIALGPDGVIGNGVCCPGGKGVGSEQFHE